VPFQYLAILRNWEAVLILPPSIDASICLRVGLGNVSRIDSFRSDFFRAERFCLFARVDFLFGLVSSAAIRSVTAVSQCITSPCHIPARTGSQRTSLADVANGFTAETLFCIFAGFRTWRLIRARSARPFGARGQSELVRARRHARNARR
jgi:hypothetical protein